MKGVEAVAFLDYEGEAILTCSTNNSEQLKILGAYQGIMLSTLQNLGLPKTQTVVSCYDQLSVLTHYLKDGYFICALLSKDLNYASVQYAFEEIYPLIEEEL
ncbi:MAG TPA: hypothetical protein VH815_14635 [Acidobacteriota bacterium]